MAIIKFENWDSVTPAALPSGWTAALIITATGTGPTPISSPNDIELVAAGLAVAATTITWGTPDSVSGNVSVQGTGSQPTIKAATFSVLARGSANPIIYASSTFYEAVMTFGTGGGSLALNAVVAGSVTQLASISFAAPTANVWYQITLTCNGTAISATLQRLSDGDWLTSGGVFQSGVATAIAVTDSSVTGSGYAAWAASTAAGSTKVFGDDWTFSSLGAASQTDGSPVFPSRATAARILAAYQDWRATPQIGDGSQPPGNTVFQDRISWPGLTAAPKRTANTAYQARPLAPQIGDGSQPSGQIEFPDVARGLGRAATYDATNKPIGPDVSKPATPFYPVAAPGPRRAAADAYDASDTQTEIPSSQLMGSPISFPAAAPGARRAPDYTVVNQPLGPDISLPNTPSFPHWAYTPLRSVPTSYQGTSVQGRGPDLIPPPPFDEAMTVHFPDFARGPQRAVNYDLNSKVQIADTAMPSGLPVYQDRIYLPEPKRRAAPTAYGGNLSPIEPAGRNEAHRQSFPDSARGPRRATTYVTTNTLPPASGNESRRQKFPDFAAGPRRASVTAYAALGIPFIQTAIPIAPRASYPDQAPSAKRTSSTTYQGLLSQPIPAGGSLARRSVHPDFATVPRRAATYTAIVTPTIPDKLMPPAQPRWPDRAPASPRTSPDAYKGLGSKLAQPDGLTTAGQPSVSLPQRSPLRAGAAAYQGLVSRTSPADSVRPAGVPVYPQRADGPRRAGASSYEAKRNQSPLPQVYACSVHATLNFQPFCALGGLHIVTVSANINFEAEILSLNERHRWGDTIHFAFAVPSGTIAAPPFLTILDNSGSAVLTVPMWSWDGGLTFQADVVLTQIFSPGRLVGRAVLLSTSGAHVFYQDFDLVPGGDPASSVISTHNHEGVAGRFTIVQTRTGQLIQGSAPWIST